MIIYITNLELKTFNNNKNDDGQFFFICTEILLENKIETHITTTHAQTKTEIVNLKKKNYQTEKYL